MNFISRAGAAEKLRAHYSSDAHCACCGYRQRFSRDADYAIGNLRNDELRDELVAAFGGKWIVTDWCPFNGRYCDVADYVPYPHPPMRDEHDPYPENVTLSYRSWEPSMTRRLRAVVAFADDESICER